MLCLQLDRGQVHLWQNLGVCFSAGRQRISIDLIHKLTGHRHLLPLPLPHAEGQRCPPEIECKPHTEL